MLFVGTGDTLVFGDWAATPEGNNTRGDLVFALSLLVSALYSVDSLIQARSRWRALRSSAGELESMIWRYRSRVEPFTVGSTTQNAGPEWAFNRAIADWIDELASAANLATTDMVRSYPASVYRHHQDVVSNNPPVVYLEGGISRPVTLDVDDFHSPSHQAGQVHRAEVEASNGVLPMARASIPSMGCLLPCCSVAERLHHVCTVILSSGKVGHRHHGIFRW